MWQGIFLPESAFYADCLMFVRTPPFAVTWINICVHVKDPVVQTVDYGNTKTPSMHPRFGSATLSQLAFPGGKQLKFPMRNPNGTLQL